MGLDYWPGLLIEVEKYLDSNPGSFAQKPRAHPLILIQIVRDNSKIYLSRLLLITACCVYMLWWPYIEIKFNGIILFGIISLRFIS